MNIDITVLFVCLDDFCKLYEDALKTQVLPSHKQRDRKGLLSLSEMLLIEIFFHFSRYKDFKHYYLYGICYEHRDKFKKLPSYQRFVSLRKHLFMPLTILLHSLFGEENGVYFADSTTLKVCNNKRIYNHKVFSEIAARGKSSMGWFYGLKLHLVVNLKGQIMALQISPGNMDDRKALTEISKKLRGKCFADKGYVGKDIFYTLWERGLHLVTGIRKNMKQILMPYNDKIMLRKRSIIETIFGVLKKNFELEHTRHRSTQNAFVHILSTLVAYCFKGKKPKIKTNLLTA